MTEQPLKDSTEEDKPSARSNAGPSNIEVGGIHVDGNVYGHIVVGSNNTITTIIQGYGELLTRYDTNVRNFLEYYLGTDEHPAPFGGREKDLGALDRWLMNKQTPHYALLAAPAGRGKSALLAQWVTGLQSRPDAPHIIFFPISLRFETHLESVAFAALAARAGYLFDEKVANTPDVKQYRGLFADFLKRPHPDGKPTLVVLDGLDEAANWTIGEGLFPRNPPDHLKVLIAARPLAGDNGAEGWLTRLGWTGPNPAQQIPLDRLSREGVRLVLEKMGDLLGPLALSPDLVETLFQVSEGDPLIIRLYVDEILARKEQGATLSPEEIRRIKPGLDGYFQYWFELQEKIWGDKTSLRDKSVRGLLNLCASAEGPLSNDDVLAIEPEAFEGDTFLLEGAAKDLNRFVLGDGVKAGYVFSHPRLREYFAGRLAAQQRRAWQERFVKYGQDTVQALQHKELDPKEAPSYVLQYYPTHLENINAPPEEYYELVCQPWAQAWLVFDGTYTGFLNDVGRAWEMAEAEEYFPMQLLCALCFSSSTSQSENVPSDLLALAVKEGVLSIRQALIFIEQQSDFRAGFEKLRTLSEQLTDAQLQQGFELALNMGNWIPLWGPLIVAMPALDRDQNPFPSRDYVSLIPPQTWGLAGRILKDKNIALQYRTVAGIFLGTKNRADLDEWLDGHASEEATVLRLLCDLAPHLPPDLLDKAFDLAQTVQDAYQRASALTDLAPHLPPHLLDKAFALAQTIEYEGNRPRVLMDVALHLPEPVRQDALLKALSAAQNMEDESDRATALTDLVPHLPEPVRQDAVWQAFTAAQTIEDEYSRASALMNLAPHLPPHLLDKTFDLAQSIQDEDQRAKVLTGLSLLPHLPEPVRQDALRKALSAAQTMESDYPRASILTDLAPHLPPDLLGQAFDRAQTMQDEYERARVLVDLAPHLSEPIRRDALRKALTAAQNIEDESNRAWVLTDLVPHLPEPVRQDALLKAFRAAQNIQNESNRASALTDLIPHLPEPVRRDALLAALRAAQNIQNESNRASALTDLIPHLPPDLLGKAFEIAQTIGDEPNRASALIDLAPHLPPSLLDRAFDLAQNIRDPFDCARALTDLAPHLPEPVRQDALRKALSAAQYIGQGSDNYGKRATVLTSLAPHLPPHLLDKAFALAQKLEREDSRARALAGLAPHLPPHLLDKAFDLARTMQEEGSRATALTGLAPHLPERLRQHALRKAFRAAQHIQDDSNRARALADLAPHLPPHLLDKAFDLAQHMQNEDSLDTALTGMAPHLPPHLLDKAFDLAQHMQSEGIREHMLMRLAPPLPDPVRQDALRKGLSAAQNIQDEGFREFKLIELAPHLPPDLLDKAFDLAQRLKRENSRIWVLSVLALYVRPELQENFVWEMLALSRTSVQYEKHMIEKILSALNHPLAVSPNLKKECIREILRQASRLPRRELLGLTKDLFTLICSTLPEAQHPPLAEQFALAILQVGEWWP